MGQELACTATIDGRRGKGKALLETDDLIFRGGDVRAKIPYKSIREVREAKGTLVVVHEGGTAAFDLGAAASKWAERIRSPKSRLDKLGVKAGDRVAVIGVRDAAFDEELRARVPAIASRLGREHDIIFYAANDTGALSRLATIKNHLAADGAIWIVRPKGHADVTESGVMAAGKAAGLVDVKVVKFSETHTAEKFVIAVKNRRRVL
jgi:hypothetical protein